MIRRNNNVFITFFLWNKSFIQSGITFQRDRGLFAKKKKKNTHTKKKQFLLGRFAETDFLQECRGGQGWGSRGEGGGWEKWKRRWEKGENGWEKGEKGWEKVAGRKEKSKGGRKEARGGRREKKGVRKEKRGGRKEKGPPVHPPWNASMDISPSPAGHLPPHPPIKIGMKGQKHPASKIYQ